MTPRRSPSAEFKTAGKIKWTSQDQKFLARSEDRR